jgi:hypothetical protein
MLRRKMKLRCDNCGKPLGEDNALFAIARVDPHSKVIRKPTEEEIADKPEDFKKSMEFGFFLVTLCDECATSLGYENAGDDE